VDEQTGAITSLPFIGNEALPEVMKANSDIASILKDIHLVLNKYDIGKQTPASGTLEYSTHTFSG